jgi:hypothetical protein
MKGDQMFSVLSNPRNANTHLIVTVAMTLAAILAFAVVPSIGVANPDFVPVTAGQNAYVDFLRGEKAIIQFDALESALLAYRQGEKDAD